MAKSKKVVPAKSPVAKAKVNGDGRTIKVLVANPKRGASKARFDCYKSGQSVEDYVARVVKAGSPARVARADVKWDSQRRFISVG
jgi:hypothetical protein